MRENHVEEIRSEIAARWPSLDEWLSKNPTTWALWCNELWAEIQPVFALEAIRDLYRDGWTWQWPREAEAFGATIRKMARESQHRRETPAPSAPAGPEPQRYDGQLAATLRQVRELAKKDPAERQKLLDREFGDESDGRRYRCGICCDTGLYTIYDGASVAAVQRHRLAPDKNPVGAIRIYTGVTTCECRAAAKVPAGTATLCASAKPGHVRGHIQARAWGKDAQIAEIMAALDAKAENKGPGLRQAQLGMAD